MIKIKNIEIGSYKLFKNTSLDLTSLSGVISVQGDNRDIKNFSANSVGKSTLPNAVLHCLYGKNIMGESIEKVTNVYTKEKPSVTITFSKEDKEYVVINDYNNNTLKVYEEGVLLQHPRKTDLFKAIEDILGISQFLMLNLIYLSPTSTSLFSSAGNDSQSKFIQQLLNLEFIGDIYKRANADLKTYKGDLNLIIKEVSIKQNQIESLNKQLNLIPDLPDKDYQPMINDLSGDLSRLETLQTSKKKIVEKVNKEYGLLSKKLIELKSDLNHLKNRLQEEKDLIAMCKCPTCSQSTSDLQIKTDISLIKKLEKEIEEVKEQGIKKKVEFTEVQDSSDETASEILKLRKKIDDLKREQQHYIAQQASLEVKENLREQLVEAVSDLVELQDRMQELEKKVYILNLISECSSPKGFVKERISLFLQLYNIELQKLAKELLGREYLVEITKTQSNHYELSVDDGDCVLAYNSLSSGFKARMDIVLVLALNKAVEILTGISINILIIDETLSSIDDTGIESIDKLLNKIKNMYSDKLIFLVTHNQSLKTDSTLTIIRENNVSSLSIL